MGRVERPDLAGCDKLNRPVPDVVEPLAGVGVVLVPGDRFSLIDRQRDIVFAAFGGWDAAGAKSFGYRTVWVNRFKQPVEELGVRPDRTVSDLNGLLEFVLERKS